MKTYLIVAAIFVLGSGSAPADTLFLDSFDYNSGTTLASQGGWTASPQGNNILVAPGSLGMDGFAAPSGNSLALSNSSSASGVENSFTAQTSGNVYMSFMLDVTSLGSLDTTGAEFAGFMQSDGNQAGNLWLKPSGSGFTIGGTVDSSVPVGWYQGTLQIGTTYLIVEQIQFPRSDNEADAFNAWVTVNGTVPSNWGGQAGPSAIQNSDVPFTNPVQDINGLYLAEGPNSPNATVDEIRVGPTWADVTPLEVPEPPTWALLVLAGVGGAFYRANVRRSIAPVS